MAGKQSLVKWFATVVGLVVVWTLLAQAAFASHIPTDPPTPGIAELTVVKQDYVDGVPDAPVYAGSVIPEFSNLSKA